MTGFTSLSISPPGEDGLRFATVGSSALGRRADVSVYVAPGAAEGAPLVVLLHGIMGSHWDWALYGRAHIRLRALVEQGRVRPLVLAMPSDGLWGMGSGYIARPGEDAEAWIRDDVPRLAGVVHAGAGNEGFCIGGLSMGGYGALRIAARHPELFSGVAGTSSVTSLDRLRELTGASYVVPSDQDSLLDVIASAGSRMPPFRLDCGTEDELLEANRDLHQALEACGVAHDYFEYQGPHDWPYWAQRVDEILLFFERVLA